MTRDSCLQILAVHKMLRSRLYGKGGNRNGESWKDILLRFRGLKKSAQYFTTERFRVNDLVEGITDRGLLLRKKGNFIGNE